MPKKLKKGQKNRLFSINDFGIYFIFKIVYVLKRALELILELYNVFESNTYFLFYQAFERLNFLDF